MAINATPVDSGNAGTGGATTLTATWDSAGTATLGNLLVATVSINGDSGVIPLPTGWTLANKHEGVNVSGADFYKTSDGTESGITIDWGNNRTANIYIAEFAATDLDLVTAPLKAEDETNVGTSVTSQSTGTTAATTVADALAIATFHGEVVNNVDAGRGYTTGYDELYFPNASTRASVSMAVEVLSSTGTQTCTFTTTDTGDEMYGQMLVFQGTAAGASAGLTGTATATIGEADIVTGGKTIILTLTGDTWVTAGATFDAQRQNIIDGLDSAQAEGTGWDAEVKAKEVVGAVVRTSDTVVTITLSAAAAYDITAQETITATIPATALTTSASAVVATPTFTVDPAGTARIASVDSPVLDAETGNALTTADFGGEPTTLTIEKTGGTHQINIFSTISGTGGSYTFDMPDVAAYTSNTAGTPFDTASHTHTITVGDGTDTDDEVIVVNPKTGWAVVEVASAVTTEGSVFFGWTGTPANTDQVYYPTANNTSVAADGTLTTDQTTGSIDMQFFDTTDSNWKPFNVYIATTGDLTGTITSSVTETDIVTGGNTIITTLTDDTFDATLGADNAVTTAYINGLVSAQSETNGWNAERSNITFANVVRTSATVCTVTLPALASYDITTTETITQTIPASALVTSSNDVVVTPTFTIDQVIPANAALTGTATATITESDIVTGGKTIILTLTGDTFVAAGTGPIGSTADTQALIDGISAATTPLNGWNNEVRDKALTSEIVRTSSTVATWTVGAQSGYSISSQETITATIPIAVLVDSTSPVVASPAFTVNPISSAATELSQCAISINIGI